MILRKKYNQIMERIEITDEMRKHILNNIKKGNLKGKNLLKLHLF